MAGPTLEESIAAIRDSRPPVTDAFAYLTIVEAHLRTETLPTLQEVLADAELTQSIGWDLIQLLLPVTGSEECLTTIARLGNPREVILKVTEALSILAADAEDEDADGEDDEDEEEDEDEAEEDEKDSSPRDQANKIVQSNERSTSDRFCILVGLLAILHPRIKTKYPSRFLSTSLMAVLSAYQPTHQATQAVTRFVHAIALQKRPMLPQRTSSMSSLKLLKIDTDGPVAPDPEAAEEDSGETAIQKKLLQSFITHVIEEYVKVNGLEWAARLQEHFDPARIIPNRQSTSDAYKSVPDLQERDICVGQLVARARDLGLTGHKFLFESLDSVSPPTDDDDSDIDHDTSPSSPDEIPLSKTGCLFLVTSYIFGAVIFDTKEALPPLKLFPDHAALINVFIGVDGPTMIGTENEGTIDAILAVGLWLEHNDAFVSGSIPDGYYLQDLQTISLISANAPSPTLRYHAHLLTSNVLHAHPSDRVRLTFIMDTLEHCPYENLKGSAISWLKEEFLIAHERDSDNIFSTALALQSVQPYLYADLRPLLDEDVESYELWQEVQATLPFSMAVVNFTLFIANEKWTAIVPQGMLSVAQVIYLEPFLQICRKLNASLAKSDGSLSKKLGEAEAVRSLQDAELLEERLRSCLDMLT